MAVGTGTAILGSALVGGGLSLYSGRKASKDARKASSAESQSIGWGIDELRKYYDLAREDLAPWRKEGEWGLEGLKRGIGTYEGYIDDPSSYMRSPGYDWLMGEGVKAIDRSASSRGKLDSGQTSKDLTRFGQGLASQDYDKFLGRYRSLLDQYSGVSESGRGAATSTGAMGMSAGGSIADLYSDQGAARAGGYINRANARTGMYRSLADIGSGAADQYMMSKYLSKMAA